MALTNEQILEVQAFQVSLSHEDEWLFYHIAWAAGDTEVITFQDKYDTMKRWDSIKKQYLEDT